MLRYISFTVIGILFLSGFFFLDQEDANPYRERDEPIDEQTLNDIKRNHHAAVFAAEQEESGWIDSHFKGSFSSNEMNMLLLINDEIDPVLSTEEENKVTLSWSGIQVQYEKVHHYWKITSIMEER